MIVQAGMNRYRDLIEADITDGGLGDDGTEVTLGDTSIGNAITGTDKTVSNTTFYNGIKISYSTSTGNGSGNIAREFILENASNTLLHRMTFPGIDIDDTTLMEVDTQLLLIQDLSEV